jgi:hypothetical protein
MTGGRQGRPSRSGTNRTASFCRQLDKRLAAKGSPARCWAHLDECGDELGRRAKRGTRYFSWSGRNSWIDRSIAAKQFWNEIEYLNEKGWTCHVVAHSHGGNVVLEALDLDDPARRGGLSSNFVLLGTPILRFSTPTNRLLGILERFHAYTSPSAHSGWGPRGTTPGREATLLRTGVGVSVSLAVWALLAGYFLKLTGLTPSALFFESITFWAVAVSAVAVVAALYWYRRTTAVEAAIIMSGFAAARETMMIYPPRLLFINSERDEAFGFLDGVKKAKAPEWLTNPDQAKRWFQTVAKQAEEADRQRYPWHGSRLSLGVSLCVAGVAAAGIAVLPFLKFLNVSWLPAFFASSFLIVGLLAAVTRADAAFAIFAVPWRFAEAGAYLLTSFVRKLAGNYFRGRVWSILQEMAFGISGSPHRLEDVSVFLRPHSEFARGEFLYQDLAKAAEDAAVGARSGAFYSALEEIKAQSDAEFWRLDTWRERIGTFARNPQLVHNVYYSQPEVIEQVASHLARSRNELMAERFHNDAVKSMSPVAWAQWAAAVDDALMEGLGSRDPVTARVLLDEMRHVAEARNDGAMWKSWAKASFSMIVEFGSRPDFGRAQELLDDLREVAKTRNEADLWEWWAKASFSLILDLGSRRDPVAAQALLDAASQLEELSRFGDLAAKMFMAARKVTPFVVRGGLTTEELAAARVVWPAKSLIDEARREAHEWKQWATRAIGIQQDELASRDPAAAQVLLNDLRGVAEAGNEAALKDWAARASLSLSAGLGSPRDLVLARSVLDILRSMAEAGGETARWEAWAVASLKLAVSLGSRDPAMSRALVNDIFSAAEKHPEAFGEWTKVVGLVLRSARTLTKDLAPDAARAFYAETLRMPESMLQMMKFGD